ncbi:MAG: LysM peptidoglycan-binding domain-containing protein [Phycisphaerales bacterium JB041]
MSAPSARIGAGFLALVAVWIGVYWLWEPTGTPRVSFADEAPAPAEVETPVDAVPVEPEPLPEQRPEAVAGSPAPNPVVQDPPTEVPVIEEAAPRFQDYAVRAGDTFERISRRFWGTIRHADAIAAANPFVSPTSLQVGQVLRIPSDPDNVQGRPEEGDATDLPNPEFMEYTVVKGDNLSALAQRFYGSLRYADVIFNANRDTMTSIDDLQIGQVLRIPSRANVLGEDE